jgi:hypothetical protein
MPISQAGLAKAILARSAFGVRRWSVTQLVQKVSIVNIASGYKIGDTFLGAWERRTSLLSPGEARSGRM